MKSHPNSIVRLICAERGKRSAAEVGAIFGMTKNAVIGIWWRHSSKPLNHSETMRRWHANRSKAGAQ